MKIVGITGGIGSGKTTVCKIFEQLGVPVFYADEEGRKILLDKAVLKQLVKLFGEEITAGGSPDRKKIAEKVFKDESMLEKLNALIHPAVQKKFKDWCRLHKKEKFLLKEAAILFESGTYKDCDYVITVSSPENIRIKRAVQRGNITVAEVKRRMKNQMPEKERISRSDFVIKNDEHSLLIPQVLEVHKKLS